MSLFDGFIAFIFFQFDNVLLISIGGFYLTPSRLFILYCICLFVVKFNSRSTIWHKKESLFFYIILAYLFSHILSLFYSRVLTSTRLSYFLFDIFLIIHVLSRSRMFIRETQRLTLRFLLNSLWLINVLVYALAIVSSDFFDFQSSFYNNRKMYGLFLERFYFSIFLIVSTHTLVLLSNKITLPHHFMILGTVLCVLGSLSFSGILGLITFIPYFWITLRRNIVGLLLLVLLMFGVNNLIRRGFTTANELESVDSKLEKYISSDLTQTNWRVFSSLLILKEFDSNPTLFGNGFRSNIFFLHDFIENADDDKFASSHTLITTLYDQGLIGFLTMILLFFVSIYYSLRCIVVFFKCSSYSFLYLFAIYFLIAVHILFYYQEYLPVFYILPIFVERFIRLNRNESSTLYT